MVPASSGFAAIITGRYGDFGGFNSTPSPDAAAGNIMRLLNTAGIVIESRSPTSPGVVSQLLEGDILTSPYQDTLRCHTTFDYASPDDIRSQISLAYGTQLNGHYPDSVALQFDDGSVWESTTPLTTPIEALKNNALDGVSSAVQSAKDAASAATSGIASGLSAIEQKAEDLASKASGAFGDAVKNLEGTFTKTLIILGVVVVGALVIVAWGPNTGKIAGLARVRNG